MDPTILFIFAVIGMWTCLGVAVLAVLCAVARRTRRKRHEQVFAAICEAIERHPAGSAMFSFRARPCGHLLYTRTLDVIDMEHVELTHVSECQIALRMLPNQKGEAA